MRKSAQTFLRRAATTTRAMQRAARRRDAVPRVTATRRAHMSPTHRRTHDCPRPLQVMRPPLPSCGRDDRRRPRGSSTGAGTHLVLAHRRRARRRHAADARSPPACLAHPCRTAPAPRRKTGTDREAGRANRLMPHAANTMRCRCCPAVASRRLRNGARGGTGDVAAGIPMARVAMPTRTMARARRAAPKKKPAALGGRFGCRDGRSAQWPSSSSSSAYSSGDSSSFNCSASSASSTRIQPSP